MNIEEPSAGAMEAFDRMLHDAPAYSMDNSDNQLWKLFYREIQAFADGEKAKALVPLCIGRRSIARLAEEGAFQFDDGRGLVAADDLFRQDPWLRAEAAEKALATLQDTVKFMEDSYLESHGGSWGKCLYQDRVEQAEKALAEAKKYHYDSLQEALAEVEAQMDLVKQAYAEGFREGLEKAGAIMERRRLVVLGRRPSVAYSEDFAECQMDLRALAPEPKP